MKMLIVSDGANHTPLGVDLYMVDLLRAVEAQHLHGVQCLIRLKPAVSQRTDALEIQLLESII